MYLYIYLCHCVNVIVSFIEIRLVIFLVCYVYICIIHICSNYIFTLTI
jgi:hypothetical protein